MNLSLRARLLAVASLALAAACSSSSSDEPNVLGTVTQDLTADPNGFVTAVTFDEAFNSLGAGAFESDGGQTALSVTLDGTTAYVTWDERVTFQHRVRVVGVPDVPESWRRVQSQDERRPGLTITSATQDTSDTSLGGDELVLTFSDGPRLAAEAVVEPGNWTITALGTPLDLTGSNFVWDEDDQELTITLGPSAHLHATFNLIAQSVPTVTGRTLPTDVVQGVAVGDTTVPNLISTTQNLDPGAGGDEFGRVIEFRFDEPMSPLFAVQSSNFTVLDHAAAQGQTLVTSAVIDSTDNTILRVTFSRPVVPGLDRVQVQLLRDAHGNIFPRTNLWPQPSAITANGFAEVLGLTREGLGNDQIVVTLDQAIDPDTAEDPARWTLTLGAPFGAVDLSQQTLTYSLLEKELVIDLDFDVPNGTTVDLAANGVVDVDGESFVANAAQVACAGDAGAPSVASSGIVQRRDLDPSGTTVDVTFSEALDASTAEVTGAYTFSPAVSVTSATLLADPRVVRLALAEAAIPGIHTLTIAATIADPAGNTLAAVHGPASLATTDLVGPNVEFVNAQAVEGADNDTIQVFFNDWMIPSDIESVLNWAVESPIGTSVDVSTSTVDYDVDSRVATLVVAQSALKRGETLRVDFQAGRDLGGNSFVIASRDTTVGGEGRRPSVESAWRRDAPNENVLVVRFSEAVDRTDDLYDASTNPTGVKYTVFSDTGVLRGRPTAALPLDGGLGVELAFPFTVALTDTLDIVGLEDLAGNVMFPTLARVLEAEDATAPGQGAAPILTAISGERNDTLEVTFAVPMASWWLAQPDQYTLQESGGGDVIDLTGARFQYDGQNTLTITLSGGLGASLQSGTTYDLTLGVDAQNPLRTAQGIAITAPSVELGAIVVGDIVQGPTQGGSQAVLDPSDANSVLVIFDEAVAVDAAETAAQYDLDGGNLATAATRIAPRVVRATFGVPVSAGQTLEIGVGAAVDLAGNAAAGTLTLSVVADTTAPLLTGAEGEVLLTPGVDVVRVTYSELPDQTSALDASNYTVTDSRGTVIVRYAALDTTGLVVSLYTADLLDGDTFQVVVDGVTDVAGNAPTGVLSLGGSVSGDSVAPAFTGAFVNLAADATGRTIDIELSEPVAGTFIRSAGNWSTTGTATVTGVEVLAVDHVRLTTSQALGVLDEVELAPGLSDIAGNVTVSALRIDPAE